MVGTHLVQGLEQSACKRSPQNHVLGLEAVLSHSQVAFGKVNGDSS